MARLMKGRDKIAMKKMENKNNLNVTFSKRRENVFKKASELCTLSGAEIAIILFSPGKKVYSFGPFTFQSIVERFLSAGLRLGFGDRAAEDDDLRKERVRALNEELDKVTEELELEKKKAEELTWEEKASQFMNLWNKPVEELTMKEATALMEHLKKLKAKLDLEIDIEEGFAYMRKLFEEP